MQAPIEHSQPSDPFDGALAVKVERAALSLDCSRSQVYELLGRGELRGIRLGSGHRAGVRVCTASLRTFGEEGGTPARHVRKNPRAGLTRRSAANGSSRGWRA